MKWTFLTAAKPKWGSQHQSNHFQPMHQSIDSKMCLATRAWKNHVKYITEWRKGILKSNVTKEKNLKKVKLQKNNPTAVLCIPAKKSSKKCC